MTLTDRTAPRDIVRHPAHPEVRLPRSPGRGSDAALKIAALLGGTTEWEPALLEEIADILGRHGFTHPGDTTPGEQAAYARLATALNVAVDAEVECPECGAVFDLTDTRDADEWSHGHDCEAYGPPAGFDSTWEA